MVTAVHCSTLCLADLTQDFGGVLTKLRRRPLRRHRPAADDDRRAHARDRTPLGRRAGPIDPHAAMDHMRVRENLVERIDRPGWNSHRIGILHLLRAVLAWRKRGPVRGALYG